LLFAERFDPLVFPIFISSCRFGGVPSIRSAIFRVASSRSGFLIAMADNSKNKVDTAFDEVCAALGRAISCWSEVESELSRIYAVTIRSPNLGVAVEAFYAVIGFDSKLKMTDVAVRGTCGNHPDVMTTWANLVNRIKRQSKTRNKLAHGAVKGLGKPMTEFNENDDSLQGCWFIPYYGMLRYEQGIFGIQSRAEKFDAGDLKEIGDRFLALTNELQRLFLESIVGIASGKKK